jgi:hypothetical protein
LHWQGKFRGVEFAPMHFMLKTATHERLKDSKGRLIPTVVCDWISEDAKEEIAKQKVTDEDRLLQFIQADPKATLGSLAASTTRRRSNGFSTRIGTRRPVIAPKTTACWGGATAASLSIRSKTTRW